MATDLPELFYWLALNRIEGLSSINAIRLLKYYESVGAIFTLANPAELSALGLKNGVWRQIAELRESVRLRREILEDLQWLANPENHLITIQDSRYPALLREIPDPPPSLFVQGDPTILSHPQLAVVGSRKASRLGLETAFNFARQLSDAGLVVTSGLALGIDGQSHKGAISGELPTVAVLGSGLCSIYPSRHRRLATQIIADGGSLVSEFPLHARALPFHFPRRNRIISGLSLGTLVVEAELRSGSLITARLALEQNREVFALPGSIYNPGSAGCHWLIKQGAKLVENLGDIFEEIDSLVGIFRGDSNPPGPNPPLQQLSGDEQRILGYLDHEPLTIDALVEVSRSPIPLLTSTLVSLELKGLVRSERSGYALIPEELRR